MNPRTMHDVVEDVMTEVFRDHEASPLAQRVVRHSMEEPLIEAPVFPGETVKMPPLRDRRGRNLDIVQKWAEVD